MGIGSNSYAVSNCTFLNHRVGNHSSSSDSAIHYISTVCQNSLSTNLRLTFQGNISFDLDFGSNLNINVDVSCFRIDKTNTINHVLLINTATHHCFRSRKSYTVVYSKTFIKIFESIGPNLLTRITENTNHVSNIVLSLGIVGVDVFKSLKKTLIVKYISSCIDFLNLLFKVCGIFLLNNTKNFSIIVTDDTTVSERICRFSC